MQLPPIASWHAVCDGAHEWQKFAAGEDEAELFVDLLVHHSVILVCKKRTDDMRHAEVFEVGDILGACVDFRFAGSSFGFAFELGSHVAVVSLDNEQLVLEEQEMVDSLCVFRAVGKQ